MLDPICTVKDRQKKKLAPKTMVRFCKGDPVLVTGDINGDIDVYRLNRNIDLIQANRPIWIITNKNNESVSCSIQMDIQYQAQLLNK